CEESLKRLQRDTIDYYQLHSARVTQLKQGECIEAMQQLQQEGKIRYWGVSLNTFDPEPEGNYLLQNNLGSGIQVVLNIINQKGIGLIKNVAAKGYGVIARMPLQFGLLTGKFTTETQFENNDHRSKRLTKDVISQSTEALKPVWGLCEKYKISKTALALSYILSYSEVSTVIPGIRTSEQVLLNTTGLVTLSKEDRESIESLGQTTLKELLTLIESKG
ncbi:MAG TPA: aldo/keto reductase, partial [Chitinophagaceae bacterium]|nr:aldo/keto reductase [Chitinophagaceae bacterium]